jgi:hypothetical protein
MHLNFVKWTAFTGDRFLFLANHFLVWDFTPGGDMGVKCKIIAIFFPLFLERKMFVAFSSDKILSFLHFTHQYVPLSNTLKRDRVTSLFCSVVELIYHDVLHFGATKLAKLPYFNCT